MSDPHPDALVRFILEHSDVRGQLVHLDESWRALLARRDYPGPLRRVLGEAAAASALLASTIKFNGSLILQAKAAGVLRLLVVEATSGRTLRGLVRWDETADAGLLARGLGEGHLVMTIDPGEGGERYQGIVALHGRPLADALRTYFTQSEQLPTRLWLAADERRAAGLLLQHLPVGDGRERELDPDTWDRVAHLAETVTPAELLGLDAPTLLHRLFHQERVRVFTDERWEFACGCSRAKVSAVLRMLGTADVRRILAEEGEVSADCEFCSAVYRFDAVDVEEVFASAEAPAPSSDTRH